ncbi:isoaspartyl dipeptidase [Ophiostoma piceae UAMH 11346]|uniref:Isoaspartyl dipeptidase n=1 Tax=Ophiostoma piceae (strain UAMH 11346) TaxID=1262450 RepID=S3C7V5_OPHP1|nr:isoaspartyl dipeptidase [Ophiostoma piceae UAMH 11346]
MSSQAYTPGIKSWAPWSIDSLADVAPEKKKGEGEGEENKPNGSDSFKDGVPSNVAHIHRMRLDPALQPACYEIACTHPESRILLTDVRIIDGTGHPPFLGDVLIEGEHITTVGVVPNREALERDPQVRVFTGRGRTLLPGLGDAHTHFTWNGGDLDRLGELGIEEHMLLTARSAQCFLDSGFTMCFGAASAKDRLDVVARDAINAGDIPGPRYLANAREIAKPNGELVAGITAFADGPEAMRATVRRYIKDIGVDNVKLSMSGEEICDARAADVCFFSDAETEAAVSEAHSFGKRVCAHARARDSVTMCVRHDVDVIYHASYTDDEGMDMLEHSKEKIFVVPALNWLWATLYEAQAYGYPQAAAEKAGYRRELEAAVAALREMHRRGIVVLPGGDYGFAWTPHGTYARDLEHFVRLLNFTPHEAIIAATAGVAKLMMRDHELGQIRPSYYADCVLVNGDPLDDITVLQDHDKLDVIIINGRVHKARRKEYIRASSAAGVVPDIATEFAEIKSPMQKAY